MKKVSITLTTYLEDINDNLNKIRELKEKYLTWCVSGNSSADEPEDMLTILRDLAAIDYHFLMLKRKIYNQQNREKGEEINFPEVE